MSLGIVPCSISDALEYVAQYHRHGGAAHTYSFALAVADGETVRGVAIVGHPVARRLQDGWTAEIIRLCTDGAHNACSMLSRAAWRAARALGYRRLVTYTLASEGGASLRAAGWTEIGRAGGGSWSRRLRPRVDRHPTQVKLRWEIRDERMSTPEAK